MATGISGSDSKVALPLPSHLMQAEMYKYWTSKTPEGKIENIEEVYLLLTNRNDGSCTYFKIDLDSNNYPVITTYDSFGHQVGETIKVAEYPSFEDFASGRAVATPELGRIAELRISSNDIFSKFEKVCQAKEKKELPAPDFKTVYSKEDLNKMLLCGRISKRKHTLLQKESTGDSRCSYCSYRSKCLGDSGINFKKPISLRN
jgi:hypothetical protein